MQVVQQYQPQSVPQLLVNTNQVMGQAISELMDKIRMEHMTVSNDLGDWLILKCDQSVHIEFIGKYSH